MKRLDFCEDFLNGSEASLYDLFCDHGKLGEKALGYGHKVTFNDKRSPLISDLKERFGDHPKAFFSDDLAQSITLERDAVVFLLGVGGHLMIDCLESWQSSDQLKGRIFVAIPAYYSLELRLFLRSIKAKVLKEGFAWEKKRGYHCYAFHFDDRGELLEPFCLNFWKRVYHKEKGGERYLKLMVKNLKNKKEKTSFEVKIYDELQVLLA